MSSAGIFRLVMEHLGIDDQRGDERKQEGWWATVERAMDEALRPGEGDHCGR